MPYWELVPDSQDVEKRSVHRLDDPATAVLLGGSANYSGEYVNETSALSLSAIFRAVSLISQTVATLPLKSYRTTKDDQRERITTWLDDPAGPESLTPFEWKETVLLHLLLQGEAFLYHRFTDGGALVGLEPVHPLAVSVDQDWHEPESKVFWVSLHDGGRERLTAREMTHICGPRTEGLRGYSFLSAGRNSVGIGLAAERSAAGLFANGPQIGGVLVPREGENLSRDDARALRADLDRYMTGANNAGKVPLLNRILQFEAWQMTNLDAQWLESRVFQIEEVSRWTGVPPFLLMQMEKQTSWGTGISEQNDNLARHVLKPWCDRITARLSRLLKEGNRFCEFDFAGLLAGSAKDVSAQLMAEVNGGLRTLNEARRIMNLEPVPGGDQLRIPSGVQLQAQLEASAAVTEAEAAAPAEAQPVPVEA